MIIQILEQAKYAPSGGNVTLLAEPFQTSDNQTFTVYFADPQGQFGTYPVSIGPDVLDDAGNVMNQNHDYINGDGYGGYFNYAPYNELVLDGWMNGADLNVMLSLLGTETESADYNKDGVVNVQDLNVLLLHFGSAVPIASDLNGDNIINSPDLNILLSAFGGAGGPADFVRDGVVNERDLEILLAWFGRDVPMAATPLNSMPPHLPPASVQFLLLDPSRHQVIS